jgi:hypothetical protein
VRDRLPAAHRRERLHRRGCGRGKELTFAAKAEPALRLLLSGNPANIDQITETTGVNADVLARTLLNEGLCGELTDELAEGYLGVGSHTA